MRNTFVSKTDLALAYFPHLTAHSARNKLMSLIRDTHTDLMDRLNATGYRPLQKDFSPRQVSIIIDHFGNPFS